MASPASPIVADATPTLAPHDEHWLQCLRRHHANLKASHTVASATGRTWLIRDLDIQLARTNEDIAYLTGEVVR